MFMAFCTFQTTYYIIRPLILSDRALSLRSREFLVSLSTVQEKLLALGLLPLSVRVRSKTEPHWPKRTGPRAKSDRRIRGKKLAPMDRLPHPAALPSNPSTASRASRAPTPTFYQGHRKGPKGKDKGKGKGKDTGTDKGTHKGKGKGKDKGLEKGFGKGKHKNKDKHKSGWPIKIFLSGRRERDSARTILFPPLGWDSGHSGAPIPSPISSTTPFSGLFHSFRYFLFPSQLVPFLSVEKGKQKRGKKREKKNRGGVPFRQCLGKRPKWSTSLSFLVPFAPYFSSLLLETCKVSLYNFCFSPSFTASRSARRAESSLMRVSTVGWQRHFKIHQDWWANRLIYADMIHKTKNLPQKSH